MFLCLSVCLLSPPVTAAAATLELPFRKKQKAYKMSYLSSSPYTILMMIFIRA